MEPNLPPNFTAMLSSANTSADPENENSLYQQHLQAAARNLLASSQYPSNLHPHHPSINPFGQHHQPPPYNLGNMQVPYQSSSRPPTPTYGSQAGHSSSPVESSGFFGAYGAGVSASPVESGTFFGAYGAGFSSSSIDSASPMSAAQRNMHEVEHEESKDSSPDEEIRKGRTNWTKKENERLISSWIKNSVDSIEGNGKRGDYYWKQVAEEYNKNSPANEIRSVAQCKGHWSKTTPLVSLFHACYIKIKNVYASGQSEEELMEKTRAMYLNAGKVKRPFALEYWWRVVKEEPKWRNLYMEEDLGGKRHKLEASGAYTSSLAADSEGTDRVREPRPQGTKAAKEARKLKGKVKAKACHFIYQKRALSYCVKGMIVKQLH